MNVIVEKQSSTVAETTASISKGANKMNQEIVPQFNRVSITSLEIAELTGKEHRNVLRDIEEQLGQLDGGVLRFEQTYTHPQNGQTYRMYRLPKLEALILVSGYDVKLRAKIVYRLEELESKQPQQLPQTYEEIMQNALLLASSKVEELKQKTIILENKIETDAPKVEFANRISSAVGSLTIQDFSKIISDKTNYVVGEKTLFKILRSHGILMGDNKPYQKYIDMGVLELKELSYTNPSTGDKVIYTKTKVTIKGQKYLIDRIDKIMQEKQATSA